MPVQTIEPDPESLSVAMLCFILEHHPGQLHVEEVIREMATDPTAFADRDTVTVALDNLHRSGLAHRNGEFVFASRAAVQAHALHG
jgi:hypothetical protein